MNMLHLLFNIALIGGCLDPPYGEDKYSYVPKLIQISRIDKNSNERKSSEVASRKPLSNNTNIKEIDEISYISDRKEQFPYSTYVKLTNTKRSNSIITYPSISSNESLNKDNIQKPIQHNHNNSRLSHNSNDNVETYFISPKKIKINSLQEKNSSLTESYAEKHSFVKPSSQDQNNLNEFRPEVLKSNEDTHPEGIVDSKITIQSNNKSFENVDTNLTTEFSSLVDFSSNAKIALNLTKNEVNSKGSLTSLNKTIHSDTHDTNSLKVSSNSVTMSSASLKIENKVMSDTGIAYTNNSIGMIENKNKIINKKSSSETFKQDQNLISTKLDNGIEITEREKDNNHEENGDILEPECPLESEEKILIKEMSSIKSLGSNLSFNTQNDTKKEITNLDKQSIITKVSVFDEKRISKVSIIDNNFTQNENVTNFNQEIITPLANINSILNSNLSNVDTNKSISLTEKNDEPYLEQNHEQKLIDDEIDSNIISNDSINNANIQQEIETKISLLTVNDKHSSILSNEVDKAPIDNIDVDDYNNLTRLTDLKESQDQVQFSDDNDLQISEKTDTDNYLPHGTNTDQTIIRSTKSDEKSSLDIDFKGTELLKEIKSSPLATRSLTVSIRTKS